MNFKKIEEKWQKKWKEDKIFYANPSDKPKFFLTSPYPYVNGLLHLGHAVTSLHPDVIARYKRMQGYNVLWSFAFHATGSPIVAAADKIKKRDKKAIQILKNFIPNLDNETLKKFENPEHWVLYFKEEAKKDIYRYGYSLDSRRHFFTTSLNPNYDSFVRWQFRKLKEKGYVVNGSYPVVYCPNCKLPIGDHARSAGEGETTQEFNGLKFQFNYKGNDVYLVAATLRPETVFGQTNFWINPNVRYVLIRIKYHLNNSEYDELWIISEKSAKKLQFQNYEISILEIVDVSKLLGKTCVAPLVDRNIMILPAEFVNDSMGTGLVTSVPSDAPHDYISLINLQKNEDYCKKYGLSIHEIQKIKPIPIIISKELGDMPAKKVCDEMAITDQNDPRLEEAKKKVYSLGFYTGILNKNCGEYSGMKVEDAKELLKIKLRNEGLNVPIYELTGKVVCRCGTEAVPAVVQDQWFLDYSNPEWKALAKLCVNNMSFNVESVRQQINNTIDWLTKWPCVRDHGLGTRLPWDKKWLIESLSDSTIYMSYYTIAHYLQHPLDYDWELSKKIDDDFFDYVFLGKGNREEITKKYNMPSGLLDRIRNEFLYWYPHDYRNSAKDLIQNHLTFSIFHHVAIFPQKHWPQMYDVNGFVVLGGEKMSKSKGNFKTLRDLLTRFGADVTRVASLYAGEGIDDPAFEMEFFEVAKNKLEEISQFIDFILNSKVKENNNDLDWPEEWLKVRMNEVIEEITVALDAYKYRTYIQKLIFEYLKIFENYKRLNNMLNRSINFNILNEYAINLIKMLQPAAPHLAEELWHKFFETYVSLESWPKYITEKTNVKQIYSSSLNLINDINVIKKLAKLDHISKITLIIAKNYKYDLFNKLTNLMKNKLEYKQLVKIIASEFGSYDKNLVKSLPKLLRNIPELINKSEERKIISKVKELLEKVFNTVVIVVDGDEFDNPKSNNALPLKPSILLE